MIIKFQVVALVSLVGVVTSVFDEELHNKYMTMTRSDFIEYFNQQDFTWKITHHESFTPRPGTYQNYNSRRNEFQLRTHDLEALSDLPENFDSREKWPHCESIKEISNQLDCYTCWTFGAAMTASDRTCIHKNLHVRLSEQDFECLQPNICLSRGGAWRAFSFWQQKGLVTQNCKPYDRKELLLSRCLEICNDGRNYTQDKHFAEEIYLIPNEEGQIKAELFKNGPIQASFLVFADWKDYHRGVYEHKYGKVLGKHSVRVIGYGVENGTDYWLVANSYGNRWGDNGWFKVKRFQNELGFEEELVSGFPHN